MLFRNLIGQQFKKPAGLFGHFSASFMSKNNEGYYSKVLSILNVNIEDHILEIGCGAGQAIKMICERNDRCKIDAIDFSKFMLKKAKKNNSNNIKNGRVKLILGDFQYYDNFETRYSKVFLINVIYFWSNIENELGKIFKLLKSDGYVVIYMSSPERLKQIPFAVDSVFKKYQLDYVKQEIERVGFKNIVCQTEIKNNAEIYYIKALK